MSEPKINRVYVHGDGGVWCLNRTALRAFHAAGPEAAWQDFGHDTNGRQTRDGRDDYTGWAGLPRSLGQVMGDLYVKPGRPGVQLVDYDFPEEIGAFAKAVAEGTR